MREFLHTPKEVMQAFLDGHKLQNSNYCSGDEYYLYLSDTGQICEEDGAGAKEDRVPICIRFGESWWILERGGAV